MFLPLDVWTCVAHFATPAVLRRVNRCLWLNLPSPAVAYGVASLHDVSRMAAHLQLHPTENVSLNFKRAALEQQEKTSTSVSWWDSFIPKDLRLGSLFDALHQSSELRSLALSFEDAALLPEDTKCLARLGRFTQLRSLSLDLRGIWSVGLPTALEAVARASGLQSLMIVARVGRLIGQGNRFFRALGQSPCLESFTLDLTATRTLTLDECRAIAEMHTAPRLHTLELRLAAYFDDAYAPLAAFRNSPSLKSFTLFVPHRQQNTSLAEVGCAALGLLRESPTLETVQLFLAHQRLSFYGACELARLAECPALRTLTLCLGNHPVDDAAAGALTQLGTAPCLERLLLGLSGCQLSDEAIEVLVTLGNAPTLEQLVLDVRHNFLGEWGLAQLNDLAHAPGKDVMVLTGLGDASTSLSHCSVAVQQRATTDSELAMLLALGDQPPSEALQNI